MSKSILCIHFFLNLLGRNCCVPGSVGNLPALNERICGNKKGDTLIEQSPAYEFQRNGVAAAAVKSHEVCVEL